MLWDGWDLKGPHPIPNPLPHPGFCGVTDPPTLEFPKSQPWPKQKNSFGNAEPSPWNLWDLNPKAPKCLRNPSPVGFFGGIFLPILTQIPLNPTYPSAGSCIQLQNSIYSRQQAEKSQNIPQLIKPTFRISGFSSFFPPFQADIWNNSTKNPIIPNPPFPAEPSGISNTSSSAFPSRERMGKILGADHKSKINLPEEPRPVPIPQTTKQQEFITGIHLPGEDG